MSQQEVGTGSAAHIVGPGTYAANNSIKRDRGLAASDPNMLIMTGSQPITAKTDEVRSCGMRVLPWTDGCSGNAESLEGLTGRMPATDPGVRSLCGSWLLVSGAASAGAWL
jgi:hypothetical protein